MRHYRLCIPLLIVILAACGRSSDDTRSGGGGDGSERDPIVRETTLPITGGVASSPDGIFSVLVPDETFEEEITIRIEKLSELPASEAASLTAAYRLQFKPEELSLGEGKSIQVRFGIAELVVEEIGINEMRIVYRTETEGEFSSELEPRLAQGRVWSLTTILSADFGLTHPGAATEECECDTDDTCSEGCECDSDCEGNSGGNNNPDDGECSGVEFSCASGDQCIPLIYTCDGNPECEDESDEAAALCNGGSSNPLNGDSFEPDNSFGSVSTAQLAEPQSRTLTLGDMDFIRFDIEAEQDVTILATGGTFENRVILQLYSSAQEELGNTGGGFMDNPDPVRLRQVLAAGTYYVVASPQNNQGIINYNLTITATDPLPPGPENLVVELVGSKAVLTWDAVEGGDSYAVYYGDMAGGPYQSSEWLMAAEGVSPLNTTETTMDVNGLPNYTTVYFVVVAIFDGHETYPSNEVNISVPIVADEYEENNTFETATALHSSGIIDGTFTQHHSCHIANDPDYVQFELLGLNNTIVAQTSGVNYGDTILTLYDASQEQLAENDNIDINMGNNYSRLEKSGLGPGVYYLFTRPVYEWDVYGGYQLEVVITSSGVPSADPDSFEEDNTLESVQGEGVQALVAGTPQSRTIHNAADIDFARFELTGEADVVLTTTGELGDTTLQVLNAAGEELGVDNTTGGFSSVSVQSLTAGSYFVRVASQGVPGVISSYQLGLAVYEKPAAPLNVVVTPGVGTLSVTWDDVSPATGYKVFYTYSNNSPDLTANADEGASPLAAESSPTILTGLPTDAPTSICVKAINNTALSDCSSVVNGTPLVP